MATIGELLRASGLSASESRLLLGHVLGVSHAAIAAHPEQAIDPAGAALVLRAFARRREGEPIAYITGEREFHGLAFHVAPAVLIPRPETEMLVDLALERLRDGERVLDLGTGSGAVAVAIAASRPGLEVTACDASREALDIARENAARHGAGMRLVLSDWFAALEGERFHVIVANPPYIASGDPHLEQGDLRFEPRRALEAGPSGLEAIASIAAAAPGYLLPGGWLAVEHGCDQGPACERLLREAGFQDVMDMKDLAGLPRVVTGRVGIPDVVKS